MPRPLSRAVTLAAATLAAAAFVVWRRARDAGDPVTTFKTYAAAVAVFVVVGATIWIAGHGRAAAGAAAADFLRRRRRVAALLFGFVAASVLLAVVELVFYGLNSARPGTVKEADRFVDPDPAAGHVLRPGAQADASCTYRGETIYRAHYTIDESGDRRTVVAPRDAKRAVLFLGCSCTFGEGLDDDRTVPSVYGRAAPADLPVNLGVPGYGPNNLLARAEGPSPPRVPSCPEPPLPVYLFIDAHVDRCIGAMYVVNHFAAEGPYYEARDGGAQRVGDFLHDRPVRSVAYWLLGKSQTLRFFGVSWPPAGRRADLDTTSRVIDRLAEQYGRIAGSREFALVLTPGSRLGRTVADGCRIPGLRVLDYADLFGADSAAGGFTFPHDGHPSAKGAELLGQRLAADLAAPSRGR